ncbi:carboxypeptidase S [Bimuria novae-zelandiae CBS 107.79]|uniref:Carboxypeptidase S n=1 Tax=Bimuria novae-zelandiae CBS 107.79 TaxID=1447943 RepID=A0A6A5USL6_9PLEO|nr:carboxypeptidase S [Bimuria novae-zelandiae CBS 107.79]
MPKTWGDQLPLQHDAPRTTSFRKPLAYILVLLGAAWFLSRNYVSEVITRPCRSHAPLSSEPKCPQVDPLIPSKSTKELDDMWDYLNSESFFNKSIERLSGAVKIPTQSYDDMGDVGIDPRWDIFHSLGNYLEESFPGVFKTLDVEKVNTHGLLLTWKGSDVGLKPTVLMAHQDVVPVPDATINQWTHPPFSGYWDGKFIWGRGASDCKNQLMGILEAVEALVHAGFEPKRTLVLSFGFDEEISGHRGAGELSKTLIKKYGHRGAAVIVDEGAANLKSWGANWAVPGVGEKGYVDVEVTVRMPGGHSSIPPAHNGIGVAAELISLIEANPWSPSLSDSNPYLSMLYCGAEHAPSFPSKLKHLLHHRPQHAHKDALALEAAKAGLDIRYLFTTSQAVDLISGGVKTNALPERTTFTINNRINVGSSVADILSHVARLFTPTAQKYNLTLHAFNNATETPNSLILRASDTALEPAPTTPTGPGTPFSILSGTTRALYGEDLLVAPGIMTGNTDTRYYWGLSEHIFRYRMGWDLEQEGLGNIHTVDEKIEGKAHRDAARWVYGFVRNMDEADL